MKWFQHTSDANSDMALEQIVIEFGLEGYGFYWICCELIAHQGENYRIKKEKRWLKALKKRTNLSEEKMEKILGEFSTLDLINKRGYEQGDLYMPKMKRYSDDYTKRIRRVSEQPTDKVHLDKNRIEEIRIDNINIQRVFKIFQDSVNPTINYGHKTNRQSVLDLIKLYNIDQLEKITRYAVSVQGKQYAPTITTPYQLKEKLGQLKIYHDKQKDNKVKIIL